MTKEQTAVRKINNLIYENSPADIEVIKKKAGHLRRMIKLTDSLGFMAISLVQAELMLARFLHNKESAKVFRNKSAAKVMK